MQNCHPCKSVAPCKSDAVGIDRVKIDLDEKKKTWVENKRVGISSVGIERIEIDLGGN